jgi:RarD protein
MLSRILLFLCVVIWGSTFVATKIMLDYVNPAELLGLRLIIGVPILAVVVLVKRIKIQFSLREYMNLMAGSAVVTAHFLIQITGLQYTTATNTGWIISVTPLALAVLSYFFLKERITRNVVIGIIVATAGVMLLVSRGDFGQFGWLKSVGDWLILVSAHTWAIYTIVVRNISQRKDPVAITFVIFLPIAVLMSGYLMIAFDWRVLADLPARGWGALILLGVFGTALAHWWWQEGVAALGAARAGIFLYVEPLTATALGIALLGEKFGLFTAIGAIGVLGGILIAERRRK